MQRPRSTPGSDRNAASAMTSVQSPASTDQGWFVADLLDAATCVELTAEAGHLIDGLDQPFYATSAHAARSTARRVDQWLKGALTRQLTDLLPGYQPFLAAVISKAPGGGLVAFHQDWTYTDERRDRAVLVWVPLVDTDHRSGAMRAVPGSHRWTTGVRPGGSRLPTEGLQEPFGAAATTIPLSAGQALVYDPALVHGSHVNTGETTRIAVAVALAPLDASLVHFHRDHRGLRCWRIDESYYTTQEFATEPAGAKRIEPWASDVEVSDFEFALRSIEVAR